MSEADITQHIISASRGSMSDLGQALGDIHQRLMGVEVAAMAPVTLTDGATVTPDFDAGRNFYLEFADSTTITDPLNLRVGQEGRVWFKQGTSAKTVSWGDSWDFVGTPIAATGAGAISVVFYNVHSTTSILAVMISA